MTRPPRPSEALGALEQAVTDLRHVITLVELHGRKPQTRVALALTLAAETTYGPSSANLDPTTGSNGGDVALTPTEAAASQHQGYDAQMALRERIADAIEAVRALRFEVAGYTAPAEAQRGTQRRPITDTDDCCELHALIGVWAAPRPSRTKVDGQPRRLCGACEGRHRATGELPSRADLEHHRSVGRWPKRHEGRAA